MDRKEIKTKGKFLDMVLDEDVDSRNLEEQLKTSDDALQETFKNHRIEDLKNKEGQQVRGIFFENPIGTYVENLLEKMDFVIESICTSGQELGQIVLVSKKS